jgi:hypothetical protein
MRVNTGKTCLAATEAKALAKNLAIALEASVHRHTLFLLIGDFCAGEGAVKEAAERTVLATLALIDRRRKLVPCSDSETGS